MTQTELNRAVAEATGESVDRVVRMGFNGVVMPASIPWWRIRRWQHGRQPRLARRNTKPEGTSEVTVKSLKRPQTIVA